MSKTARPFTSRDLALVSMVFAYQGCSVDHIRSQFFPSPGARTSCYRRVAYLLKQGYLAGTRMPALSGQGSGKLFLTIGHSARPMLSQALELSRSDLARVRITKPLFANHHLAICDTRLAFEIACERNPFFSLQDWEGDLELRRTAAKPQGSGGEQEPPVVPDARFTLALPRGASQTFLVEMDMGTVAPKRMQEKLGAYLKRRDDPTPVLFIVPSQSRQSAIARWALEEAKDRNLDPTIFWLTAKSAIHPETALSAPIWQIVGGPNAVAIQDIAGELAKRADGYRTAPTARGLAS